jgi:hypothetical protein
MARESSVRQQLIAPTSTVLTPAVVAIDAEIAAKLCREEAAEKQSRWSDLRKLCRTLQDELRKAELKVLQLRATKEFSQEKFYETIAASDAHLANPPSLDNFPTDAEFAEYREVGIQLEDARAALAAKYKAADAAHLKQVMLAVDVRSKLESAAFAERQLRPNTDTR